MHACHGHRYRLALPGSSVRDRKKRGEGVRGGGVRGGGSKGWTACTGGYMGVRTVRPESVAGSDTTTWATLYD